MYISDIFLTYIYRFLKLVTVTGNKYLLPGAHEGNGSFLAAEKVINILISKDSETDCLYSELPKGRKENVYFVVDNSENINRRNGGGKSKFQDDCGAWSHSSSTKKHYVFENGSPVYLELKNTIYFVNMQKEKNAH